MNLTEADRKWCRCFINNHYEKRWIVWECRKKIAHRREAIFTMYLAGLSWNTDYEMVNKFQVQFHPTRPKEHRSKTSLSSGQCQTAYKCNHQLWAVPERVVSDGTSVLRPRHDPFQLSVCFRAYSFIAKAQSSAEKFDSEVDTFLQSRSSQFWKGGFNKLVKHWQKIA